MATTGPAGLPREQAPPEGFRRALPGWFAATLAYAVLYAWAFGASLGFGFIADDATVVPNDYGEALHSSLTSQYLRPVWWLSYPLVNSLLGETAFAHHLVNHVLHLACAGLGFVLLRRWIGSGRAAVAVAAWSLAPQAVFPAVWIAQRNDSLMTMFVLLALLAAERGRRASGAALYLTGYLAKLTCLCLPLALLVPAGLYRRKGDRRAGLVLFALGCAGVAWGVQFYEPDAHIAALGPAMRLLNTAKNLALGWGLTALPAPFFATGWIIAAYAVFAAALGLLLLRHARASEAATRLLILAALASLPLMLMAELRITYLMLLFLAGAIAALPAPEALRERREARGLAATALLAWLAYAVPAAHETTARFASSNYDAATILPDPPEGRFYPRDTYESLREWQQRLVGQGN